MNAARQHFELLDVVEKQAAVRRLAREGYGDYAIAGATGLAVEQVRRVLAEHSQRKTEAISRL